MIGPWTVNVWLADCSEIHRPTATFIHVTDVTAFNGNVSPVPKQPFLLGCGCESTHHCHQLRPHSAPLSLVISSGDCDTLEMVRDASPQIWYWSEVMWAAKLLKCHGQDEKNSDGHRMEVESNLEDARMRALAPQIFPAPSSFWWSLMKGKIKSGFRALAINWDR